MQIQVTDETITTAREKLTELWQKGYAAKCNGEEEYDSPHRFDGIEFTEGAIAECKVGAISAVMTCIEMGVPGHALSEIAEVFLALGVMIGRDATLNEMEGT